MRHEVRRFPPTAWRPTIGRAAEMTISLAAAGFRLLPGLRRLQKPIFLIGCPRSGTTIAARLFGQHPDVANYFSEAGRIWDPRLYDDPQADHYWTAARVTHADAARLHAHFELWRRLQRKPRFMNKHPRTSVRIDYVRAVFPDAVFIHVLRDGRAVAESIAARRMREAARERIPMGGFCKPPRWRDFVRDVPIEEAALQWREIVQHILEKREELGDAYHEFMYEDLCADCQVTLRGAFQFAGLDTGHDTMSRFPPTLDSQNFKWRERLSQEEQRMVTEIQAPLLRELGYQI